MSDVVLKAFNTEIRRLRVGDIVTAKDDLTPHSLESLKAQGFIGLKDAPAAAKSSRFSGSRSTTSNDAAST